MLRIWIIRVFTCRFITRMWYIIAYIYLLQWSLVCVSHTSDHCNKYIYAIIYHIRVIKWQVTTRILHILSMQDCSRLFPPICIWLMHMCDVTRSYVWHDWSTAVARRIHMCDVTRAYVCHDSLISFIWGTRLIHMCDMTHSHTSFRWHKW